MDYEDRSTSEMSSLCCRLGTCALHHVAGRQLASSGCAHRPRACLPCCCSAIEREKRNAAGEEREDSILTAVLV